MIFHVLQQVMRLCGGMYFLSNQKNIILAINLFIKNLNAFKRDISIKNSNKIIKKLTYKKS